MTKMSGMSGLSGITRITRKMGSNRTEIAKKNK